MKILVVDDSSTMRRIIINMLTKIGGHEIVEAGNGREGIDKVQTGGIEFILTDWHMPEMNGLEFVRAVRETPGMERVPILMVTSNAVSDEVMEAVKAGVNGYVVKPFQPETLRAKIESVLGR